MHRADPASLRLSWDARTTSSPTRSSPTIGWRGETTFPHDANARVDYTCARTKNTRFESPRRVPIRSRPRGRGPTRVFPSVFPADGKPKQSRSEKKSRKAMQKLGTKPVPAFSAPSRTRTSSSPPARRFRFPNSDTTPSSAGEDRGPSAASQAAAAEAFKSDCPLCGAPRRPREEEEGEIDETAPSPRTSSRRDSGGHVPRQGGQRAQGERRRHCVRDHGPNHVSEAAGARSVDAKSNEGVLRRMTRNVAGRDEVRLRRSVEGAG